jgi:tRNA nucleotidyltransferase (CCA-adding enzyme)
MIQRLLPTGWREHEVLHEEQIVVIQSRGAAWSQSMKVYELKDLHITGENVLQQLGRKGGPWLGQLMKHLLRETAIGNIANQHDMLTNEVKRVAADDKA